MDSHLKRPGAGNGGAGRPARARSKVKGGAQAPRRRQATQQVRRADRAARVIAFIECLVVPSGEGQGGPFKLREWQKRFVRDIYEPHSRATERRMVRRAILSIARKNGK